MESPLVTPNPPVNMLSSYVPQHETTFTVYCYDGNFKYAEALDNAEQSLFRVEGATFGTSWSWRRKVWANSNGLRLFDFRHRNFDIKNSWVVESPDGRTLCSFVHKAYITTRRSVVDVTVRTEAGENVLVLMRASDHGYGALKTIVSVDGAVFATICKVNSDDMRFRGNRDGGIWEVRAASGVDLSLLMAMVLCRAELGSVWKQ